MINILLIDDDIDLLESLRKILKTAGFAVTTAVDGDQALELFDQQPADLVITDMIMPQRNGLETIFKLLAQAPDLPIFPSPAAARRFP